MFNLDAEKLFPSRKPGSSLPYCPSPGKVLPHPQYAQRTQAGRGGPQMVQPQKETKKQSMATRASDSSTVMSAHSTSSTTRSSHLKLHPAARCDSPRPGHCRIDGGSEICSAGHRKAAINADSLGCICLPTLF
ncbi:hypothetical protein NL676_031068 [Syzygium grande]|nr:hypothetical protein NL676_031068 [Syzygium grande]